MSFGLGYLPDVDATHDGPARAFLGSVAPSLASRRPIAFLDAIGGVGNQVNTESCVGWAFVETIALRAAALGVTLPRGSELGVYALARQLSQAIAGKTASPLVDQGCQPALAARAIRLYGLPSGASFPFDPTRATAKLTLDELETADKTIRLFLKAFLAIDETGPARIVQIRQAIDAGIPVALAVCATTPAFQGASAGVVLTAPPTPVSTNHMVSLVDERPSATVAGASEFLLLNHWGTSWGNGGLAWVDESFVQVADSLRIVEIEVPS